MSSQVIFWWVLRPSLTLLIPCWNGHRQVLWSSPARHTLTAPAFVCASGTREILFSLVQASYMGECLGLTQTMPSSLSPLKYSVSPPSPTCMCSGPVCGRCQWSFPLCITCPMPISFKYVHRPLSLGKLQLPAGTRAACPCLAFAASPHVYNK